MNTLLDRIDLPADRMPRRWYNAVPALPQAPEKYIDATTGAPVTLDYVERLWTKAMAAQEFSMDRWVPIPQRVLDAYAMWRPTPLIRAVALERYLDTPAQIWFKYEATSPTGRHKLNSALPQAYYAKREGHSRLVTDTGAGQWGSALGLACRMFGLDLDVFMVRASYHQKPYRRHLMETYGARVQPSPGEATAFGRGLLADDPDHPGSEATAVSESLETVRSDPAPEWRSGRSRTTACSIRPSSGSSCGSSWR